MHHFTHSESVVLRRGVWYLLLMLVIGLFAFGLYKATVFLEQVIEEPKGSRNPNHPEGKGTYAQYEEVVSIHTPPNTERQAPPTLPSKLPGGGATHQLPPSAPMSSGTSQSSAPPLSLPVERTLISSDGRSIEAKLLKRPDPTSITLKRLRDGRVFTISLQKLSALDREFIRRLPLVTDG